MYPIDLSGKKGLIFGVANDRSIAWAIAKILDQAGVRLAITYQNERIKSRVVKLSQTLKDPILLECDATSEKAIASTFDVVNKEFNSLDILVHSIAFANKEDLGGEFSRIDKDGFQLALEVSAYTLIPLVRYSAPLMDVNGGGTVITMTFDASNKVYPGYNVMGTAKAALENEVKQLASEYGTRNIRINAISAGPVETLAGRGISGFLDMLKAHAARAPMKRNITTYDIAKAALFLSSELSSGITGSIIPVDAGYHIMAV